MNTNGFDWRSFVQFLAAAGVCCVLLYVLSLYPVSGP
jgi:hypothetical protein